MKHHTKQTHYHKKNAPKQEEDISSRREQNSPISTIFDKMKNRKKNLLDFFFSSNPFPSWPSVDKGSLFYVPEN